MADMLGRIPSITLNPHQAELYYLRMLDHNKAGSLSFEDLRTAKCHICVSFQVACQSLGLLENNTVNLVWACTKGHLCDTTHLLQTSQSIACLGDPLAPCTNLMQWNKVSTPTETIINKALLSLQNSLERQELEVHEDFSLPKPQPTSPIHLSSYDISYLQGKVLEQCTILKRQQRYVLDTVM